MRKPAITVDVMFVDEAAQMSLGQRHGHLARRAKPWSCWATRSSLTSQQGTHPDGIGVSPLAHLLGRRSCLHGAVIAVNSNGDSDPSGEATGTPRTSPGEGNPYLASGLGNSFVQNEVVETFEDSHTWLRETCDCCDSVRS